MIISCYAIEWKMGRMEFEVDLITNVIFDKFKNCSVLLTVIEEKGNYLF